MPLFGFFLCQEVIQPFKSDKCVFQCRIIEHCVYGPNSPHRGKIFRNDKFPVLQGKNISDCPFRASICRNTSYKCHRIFDVLTFGNITLEISRKRITQASYNLIIRGCNLLEMNHIGLGKNRTSSCNPWRIFRL